jgi:hypothetical protein
MTDKHHGHTAWTRSMEVQHGHASGDMDIKPRHAARACSIGMQNGHENGNV